jgi:hypothetical protein
VKGKNIFIFNKIFYLYRDGPALWVNETLDRGQTNACPTFGNPMLTFGEKGKDETYEIHNIELFIL